MQRLPTVSVISWRQAPSPIRVQRTAPVLCNCAGIASSAGEACERSHGSDRLRPRKGSHSAAGESSFQLIGEKIDEKPILDHAIPNYSVLDHPWAARCRAGPSGRWPPAHSSHRAIRRAEANGRAGEKHGADAVLWRSWLRGALGGAVPVWRTAIAAMILYI